MNNTITKKHDRLTVFLAGITGLALLLMVIARTFMPRVILPKLDLSFVVSLTLIALVLDRYIAKGSPRDYRFIPLLGAVVFGVFPLAAFAVTPIRALWLALMGAVSFTVVTFLFDSICRRMEGSSASKAVPAVSAIGIYLAVQCFVGIF